MKTIKAIPYIVLLFSTLITNTTYSQPLQKTSVKTKTNLEKWFHATINIETRTLPLMNPQKDFEMMDKWGKGLITKDEYVAYINDSQRKYAQERTIKSATGTAIFLKYQNHYYLLTARHVVENLDNEAKPSDMVLLIQNGSDYNKNNDNNELALLSHFTTGGDTYIFSRKEHDLALVYIDRLINRSFLNILDQRGYLPISIDDIDRSSKLKAGQEITSFGFPGDSYQVASKNLHPAAANWESDIVSVPVMSRGIVVDPLPKESFFSGGIFVTNGNSGGPVVSNNKLVGIVSNQTISLEKISTPTLAFYKYRDLRFIKSSLILPLLNEIESREEVFFEDLHNRKPIEQTINDKNKSKSPKKAKK